LRRQRNAGKQIALKLGISAPPSAASCKGLGLNKLKDLEPCEPVHRYERERPGPTSTSRAWQDQPDRPSSLVIVAGKATSGPAAKGWECVAINNASPSQRLWQAKSSAVSPRSLEPFSPTTRASASESNVKTDNGSLLQILHLPKPLLAARPQTYPHQAYIPRTNGMAERFVGAKTPGSKLGFNGNNAVGLHFF
jgi:hypothetical protein